MKNERSLTITEMFFSAVQAYPDNVIFHYFQNGWKTVSYRDFSNAVISTASFLLNSGLKKGDRAAIISGNGKEWCTAYFAIIMAGGIAVPIDSQLGPDETRNLLEDSGSKTVFHSQKTLENIRAYADSLPAPVLLINFDSPEYTSVAGTPPLDNFPENDPEEIASIIYTSGTTGNPKGVMLTHKNFCSDALAVIEAGIVTHNDNILAVLPLHHTYAFMCCFLVPAFLGASITYPRSMKGPDLMSAMRDRGVNILIGVPQLLNIIRNGIQDRIKGLPGPVSYLLTKVHGISGFLRERFDINIGRIVFRSVHSAMGKGFRFFTSGGARLDPMIFKDLEAFGFTVLEGYGLTETSPVVTFNPVSKQKPGSAGKPFSSVEIRIHNPSATGEGEIAIKGPMVMKGYYKNASATAEVIKDGWFMSGDLGMIDKDGYLFITGRIKEVIVLSSGKNIYPEDVEKMYLASPLISEICVLGLEDKGISEFLHAVIVPDFEYAKKAGISNIQEEIKWELNELSGGMPSHMRIKGYSIRSEPLPRTPLGKLRRFMIKDLVTEKPDRERESDSALFRDATARRVVETLKHFLKDVEHINADDNIELDLGLDSLSKIELVVLIEKTFSLKLPEDFMSDIQTVGDLVEKIKAVTTVDTGSGQVEKSGWKEILLMEPSEKDLRIISPQKPLTDLIPAFFIFVMLKCLFKLFFRLEARGIENIPLSKNFLLAPNHTSYLDGFAVILSLPFEYFRNIYSLGLSSYFTGVFRSRLARIAHVIPIDASSYLNKALQMSAYILRNGRSLTVFPEGGRSFDGRLMEFKKGVGILAIEMGVTVVPVFIDGAFEVLPRGAKWPRFRKIRVIFGKPMSASDIDFRQKKENIDNYQYFADKLRERVRLLKTKGKEDEDKNP